MNNLILIGMPGCGKSSRNEPVPHYFIAFWRKRMPVITLEAASLNKEQKKQLVKEFTESAARIMNMPKDSFYVFLKENALDNVGVGGILLSGKKHS